MEPGIEHIEVNGAPSPAAPATASNSSSTSNDALIDDAVARIAEVRTSTSSASWAQDVFEKSLDLLDRIRYVEPSEQQRFVHLVTSAGEHMERPRTHRPLRRLSGWWFGSRIERAWSLLHQAEIQLLWHVKTERVLCELERVRRRAAVLPPSHRARKSLDETLRRVGLPTVAGETLANTAKATPRNEWSVTTRPTVPREASLTTHEFATAHDVMSSAHARTQAFQKDARAFRNRLVLTTLLALFASIVVIVMQWRLPRFDVVASPDGAVHHAPAWTLMVLVMAFGSMGALLTTIPAMSQVGRVKSPYNIPIAQGCLKIVVGSLTALVGVIIVGTTSVSKGFGSVEALLGVAAAFGAAQHVVTRLLDRRANDIIDRSPGRTVQPEPVP